MKAKPVVDYKKCMACGMCIHVCPVSCLELALTGIDKLNKAYPMLKKGCIGCSICKNECPFDVITMVT